MTKKSVAAALLLSVSLSACATRYVGTPYSAPAEPITSVGLVDDSLPKDAIAAEVASTMSNFGLLGALIDAGVQASRRDRVNDALESVNYDAEANFEAYLVEALAQRQISAAVVEGPDREKYALLTDYPEAPAGTQVLLDFAVAGYGYANAGNQMWRPHVTADVRLVDAASGRTLMENRIVYNPIGPQQGVITLAPSGEYAFQSREDMVSQPDRLAAGIDVALREVADAALRLMR